MDRKIVRDYWLGVAKAARAIKDDKPIDWPALELLAALHDYELTQSKGGRR